MRLSYNIIIVFLIINVLGGCTPFIKKVTQYDVPFERPGYSILPPQGEDWYYTERGQVGEYVLTYMKRFKSRTHTLFASITETHQSTKFNDKEEYLSFMTKIIQMGMDPRRFNVLEEQIVLDKKFGPFCIRYYSKVEDHTKVAGNLPFLTMETYGYYFVHPRKDQLMLAIIYSERGDEDELDQSFKELAMGFIDGLKLKEVR